MLVRAGGTALVEVTTPDFGRDPERLRRVAERTGLRIVMGTGWYRQPYYPESIDRTPTEALAGQMIAELTQGVGGTGIRAGIIGEIGAHGSYLTAQEERVLRAAARAQRATGPRSPRMPRCIPSARPSSPSYGTRGWTRPA